MSISTVQRTVRLSRIINLVSIMTIMLTVFFGWLYYQKTDVYNMVRNTIPAAQPAQPKYLYTIFGNMDKRDVLKWPVFTCATNDRIFVSDVRRIMVFDYNGKFIRAISPDEDKPGSLIQPAGLIVVNNELYVADPYKKQVIVYDLDGKFKRYFADKALKIPAFIKFSDGKFYIYDAFESTVKIVDLQGSLVKEFGATGSGQGQFSFPYDLDVDKDGRIWIADSNNFRIQVFDQEGKLLNVWPKGNDDADLAERKTYSVPRGIAFDNNNFAWSAISLGNYVASIDPLNGEVLVRLGTGQDESDSISLPTAVFIDSNNRLYVTESGYKRVLVYQL